MNNDNVRVKRALLSVSDKSGVVELGRALQALNIQLISTGGTHRALLQAMVPVSEVSEVTRFPEIMDGRVKTLHPKIHGGILARAAVDDAVLVQQGIAAIDLVVCNLYPFAATVQAGRAYDEVVEQIDIGGPAMIRAAAKNHARVSVITRPDDYGELVASLQQSGGEVSAHQRRRWAAQAFAHTAAYDAAIAHWFAEQLRGSKNPS